MSDFETSGAGKTLLRLVARGNAVIAEILRIAPQVPAQFLLRTTETQQKYGNLVLDFAYLDKARGKGRDHYEAVIEKNEKLLLLDQELKETCIKKLRRFYTLFEVIWKYGHDFADFIKDVEEAHYIQQTLEGILLDKAGKQLISEAVYLFGVMLLLLDQKIDGIVRERIVVSCLRYIGQNELSTLDEVARLVERTGYTNGMKTRVPNYPIKYFSRISLPQKALKMIIGRLRSDDVYNVIPVYPLPAHRSTALATQAQMLYVCLYFAPDILCNQEATMREIVDKHFPDNWVITMYLGFVVDLTTEWEPYPAAQLALANTTKQKQIIQLVHEHNKNVPVLIKQLQMYLDEGTLTMSYILKHRVKLFEWLRDANVTLRWLMLHTRRSTAKVKEEFAKVVVQENVLLLLLLLAQFEFKLKTMIQAILDDKKNRWEENQKESSERMRELSEVFGGEKALSRVKKNDRLKEWFNKIAAQIDGLDFTNMTVSGRRIQQLMHALEEVAHFHQIEENVPVKNFLVETRQFLENMIRLIHISDDIVYSIDIISDFAYARDIIYEYIHDMQVRIRKDPGSVILLRSTFLKLASILHTPTFRLGDVTMGGVAVQDTTAAPGEAVAQTKLAAKDLIMVSEYYSKMLVHFVRTVLDIIPEMMFKILDKIILLQTDKFLEMPPRVEKDQIDVYSQLPARGTLVKLTHKISLFTEGILALETTLVGVLKVDSKQLLEEGMRKILVNKACPSPSMPPIVVAHCLDCGAIRANFGIFGNQNTGRVPNPSDSMQEGLGGFQKTFAIAHLLRSFNYIQDYVNIYGLKIWQEEFQRIVSYYVERECNRFMKQVHEGAKSQYQSKIIPIPDPLVYKGDPSDNFIGRVARIMLLHTDVTKSVYLHKMNAWYSRDEREVLGIKMFDLLIESIGAFGITGLDKFFGFSLVKDQQIIVDYIFKLTLANKGQFSTQVRNLVRALAPCSSMPPNALAIYAEGLKYTSKLAPIANSVAVIGQKQLLRRQLANILRFKASLESNSLFCSLDALNQAILNDVRAHYRNPTLPSPKADNPLLGDLSNYLEHVGLHDPLMKIYIETEPIIDFPTIMFLLVLRVVGTFTFDAYLGQRPKGRKDALDDTAFAVGIITLLRQFHSSSTQKFLALFGQYVRCMVNVHVDRNAAKSSNYPEEVNRVLTFIEIYCRFSDTPKRDIEQHIPAYLFTSYGPPTVSK